MLGQRRFTVVGILDPVTLAPGLDTAALVGFEAARRYLDDEGDVSSLYVRSDPEDVDDVQSVLAVTASPEHPDEVDVSRPSDAIEARAAAKSAFTSLFLGLGAVALLVGGVGIANVMVISVLERRSEIGLRRALGATRRHLGIQFLTESLLLSLAGGIGGAALGGGGRGGVRVEPGLGGRRAAGRSRGRGARRRRGRRGRGPLPGARRRHGSRRSTRSGRCDHSEQVRALEGADRLARGLGDRRRTPRLEIDEDERLRRGDHQRVVREPERAEVVRDARPPEPLDADEALEEVVEPRGRVVLDVRGAHHELGAVEAEAAEVPVVLGARVVEVREVAAVVDDALGVGVREPDARERRVLVGRTPVGDPAELERRGHAPPSGPRVISVSGSLTSKTRARMSFTPKPSSRAVCSST